MEKIKSLKAFIDYIEKLQIDKNRQLAFRGEQKDYKDTELVPSIYRENYLENEELIYREMQRFNDKEFKEDRTTFDKLSRMQHYSAPTRLLDISEDLMSAIYFAISNITKYDEDAILYVFEIDKEKIKYYDSDAVSVVSNLVKIPLNSNSCQKSKKSILCDVNKYKNKKQKFNRQNSIKFLRHEIREEKPQFKAIIEPKDIISIFCVRPKLTSNRLKAQKGFFLLFGLNPNDNTQPIKLIQDDKLLDTKLVNHPIKKIHKLKIKASSIKNMQQTLKKLGITQPFIYPEMDKVAEYLKQSYK